MNRAARSLLLGLLGFAVGAASVSASQRARTEPISNDKVVLSVTATDGSLVGLTVRNGAMARVTFFDGPTLGLTPVLVGDGLRLVVFEITQITEVSEAMRQIDTLELKRGVPLKCVKTAWPFDIEFVGDYQTVALNSNQEPTPDGPCYECCVTCEGITACACSVRMACATCCCPAHCQCLDSPQTGAGGAGRPPCSATDSQAIRLMGWDKKVR